MLSNVRKRQTLYDFTESKKQTNKPTNEQRNQQILNTENKLVITRVWEVSGDEWNRRRVQTSSYEMARDEKYSIQKKFFNNIRFKILF